MDHQATSTIPWTEKYRPRRIQDVAHQVQVIQTLTTALKEGKGNMPHLLFYGPPGTGKTSTALALCRQLFRNNKDLIKNRVMELNASDERGIRVVRDKIKSFAQSAISNTFNATMSEKDAASGPSGPSAPSAPSASSADALLQLPIPPFKVIILDEADAITGDAQTALRRTMETYSKHTRFIIICNYMSRIIGPLASRCSKFRFKPLPVDAATRYLRHISEQEHVNVGDDILQALVESSEGDLRRAITTLQSAHRMMGNKPLDLDTIIMAACLIPPQVLNRFEEATTSSLSFRKCSECMTGIINEGYPASQLILQYSKRLNSAESTASSNLSDLKKAAIAIKLAQADSCLIDGADEWIQLQDVGARVQAVAHFAGKESELLSAL